MGRKGQGMDVGKWGLDVCNRNLDACGGLRVWWVFSKLGHRILPTYLVH